MNLKSCILLLIVLSLPSYVEAFTVTGGGGSGSGDLLSTNNLSDLTNPASARTNLSVPSLVQSLVGDCTGFPCLDGTSDGGTLIKLYGPGGFWTALQAGNSVANRSWRLPIGAPPAAGQTTLINLDEFGQMGQVDPATFAPALGADDNFVTDAEKTVIGNTSGTNTGNQTAITTPFTPAGGIAASNSQAAIAELDTEKASIASPTFTGGIETPSVEVPATLDGGQFTFWREAADTGSGYLGVGVDGDVVTSYILALPLTPPTDGQILSCLAPTARTFSDNISRQAAICSFIDPPTGGAANVTIQDADPTIASASGFYAARTSGDLFYVKQGDDIFTLPGTHVGADRTPSGFTGVFLADTGAALSTLTTAGETYTVAGVDAGTVISITGGEYQVGAGSWLSTPGTVSNTNVVGIRQTSSSEYETETVAALTIGTETVNYSVTTEAAAAGFYWPDDPAGATYLTVDTDGVSGTYSTLAAAEAALPSTFSTPYVITVAASTGVADTTEVTFTGYTPTASNPLIIRPTPSNRHNGVWSDSIYRLVSTTDAINVQSNYTTIRGLQIQSGTANYGVDVLNFRDHFTLDSSIIKGSRYGIYVESASAAYSGHLISNNIIYGCDRSAIQFATNAVWTYNNLVYNNTFYNNNISNGASYGGLTCNTSAQVIASNNLSINNGGDDFKNCTTQSYNFSSDATASGTGSVGSKVLGDIDFASTVEGFEDFHTGATSDVVGAGVDLTATFTWDIDGDQRTATMDIGADQQ